MGGEVGPGCLEPGEHERHLGDVILRFEWLDQYDRKFHDRLAEKVRQAVERDPQDPKRILTVRGAGYVFAREPDGRP